MDNKNAPASRDDFFLLSSYVAPRTATEEKLAEIWQRNLGLDRVGVVDYYEDLGGSSLLAAAIIVEIQKIFGVELEMIMLVQAPTVEELARVVDDLVRKAKG
jgi:acyl carrier protein